MEWSVSRRRAAALVNPPWWSRSAPINRAFRGGSDSCRDPEDRRGTQTRSKTNTSGLLWVSLTSSNLLKTEQNSSTLLESPQTCSKLLIHSCTDHSLNITAVMLRPALLLCASDSHSHLMIVSVVLRRIQKEAEEESAEVKSGVFPGRWL